MAQLFNIPNSDQDISTRLIIVKDSALISAENFNSLKKKLNKYDSLLIRNPCKDSSKFIKVLLNFAEISPNEYAIIYSLKKIKDLLNEENPYLLYLMDDEYKYFERNMRLFSQLQTSDRPEDLEGEFDIDIETDPYQYKIASVTLEKYKDHFLSIIRAKLALLELLTILAPIEVIPKLLRISIKYLQNPFICDFIQQCRADLFDGKDVKYIKPFISKLGDAFGVDSRKNQLKHYSHWQISSDYRKFLILIKDIRDEALKKKQKSEDEHKEDQDIKISIFENYAYMYFSKRQLKEITSGMKISASDLAIDFIIEKYKLKNEKIVRNANTDANKFFDEILQKNSDPVARSPILKFKNAVDYFMDQFFSEKMLRSSAINYLESL